jgi:hypothetical protein
MQVWCVTATSMWLVICLRHMVLFQLIDMILAERGFCNGVADESSLLGHYTEPGTVYRMIRCFSCDFNEAHRSVASTNTACRPESLPIMYNDGTRFVKVLKFEMCLPCFSILFHCLWRLVVNKHWRKVKPFVKTFGMSSFVDPNRKNIPSKP